MDTIVEEDVDTNTNLDEEENICHWHVMREVMTHLRPTGCIITATTLAPALWICMDVNSRLIVDVNPRLLASVVKKTVSSKAKTCDVNSRF